MDLDIEEQTSNETSTKSQLHPNNFHHWHDIQNFDGLASPPYQPCIQPQREAEKPQQNTMSRNLALTPQERQLEKAVQAVMKADVEASQCRLRLLSARSELLKFRTGSTPASEIPLDVAQHRLRFCEEDSQKADEKLSQAQQTLLQSSEEFLSEKSKAVARQSLVQPKFSGNQTRDQENGTQDTQELPRSEITELDTPPSITFLFFLSDQTLGAIPVHLSDCPTAANFFEQAAKAWKTLGDEAQQTKQAAAVQVKCDAAIPYPLILSWGDVRAYETMVETLACHVHIGNGPLYVKVKCIEQWMEEGVEVVILDQGPARYGRETTGNDSGFGMRVVASGIFNGVTPDGDEGSGMRVVQNLL